MGKVAVITLCGTRNYGNRLQNYALQEILKSLGCEVDTLFPCKKKTFIERAVKSAAKVILIKNETGIHIKTLADWRLQWQEHKMRPRENAIKKFENQYIKLQPVYEKSFIFQPDLNPKYDFFIAGSDQVWNPLFWGEKATHPRWKSNNYFLEFAVPEKRVAYAASFGISRVPEEWKAEMTEEFSKFKAISVRETAGAKIVKELIGKDVPVLLDPTLLLSAEHWRSIETHRLTGSERYVLAFFLGPQPKEVYAQVQEKAKELDAQIIEMMDPHSQYFAQGPDGFLEMVDHAQLVFTDSFHAAVFSILFHKPFYIHQRHLTDHSDMGSRVETLLQKTALTERVLAGQLPTNADFEKADRMLVEERKRAIQYLSDALNLNESEEADL